MLGKQILKDTPKVTGVVTLETLQANLDNALKLVEKAHSLRVSTFDQIIGLEEEQKQIQEQMSSISKPDDNPEYTQLSLDIGNAAERLLALEDAYREVYALHTEKLAQADGARRAISDYQKKIAAEAAKECRR